MSLGAFLKSKSFWLNLALGFISLLVFLYVFIKVLGASTRHGESIEMPDLKGVPMKSAISILEEKGLKYQVVDTVFLSDKPRGAITEQVPEAGSNVKQGRLVYLTLNAEEAPMVSLPEYRDRLKAEVSVDLANAGLTIGKITYKADVADGLVLAITHNGRTLQAGARLAKGTVVDLMVGRTSGFDPDDQVSVPDLLGLTFTEARQLLRANDLETGSAVFERTVSDSTDAVIYKQMPQPGQSVPHGTPIDFHLKNP